MSRISMSYGKSLEHHTRETWVSLEYWSSSSSRQSIEHHNKANPGILVSFGYHHIGEPKSLEYHSEEDPRDS